LDLRIVATHPDHAGGLAFLGHAHRPLRFLAFAIGTVVAGRLANDILYAGTPLASARTEVVAIGIVLGVVFLGPLVQFMLPMARARRMALEDYGALALSHVMAFDRTWVHGEAFHGQTIPDGTEIRFLAYLSNAYRAIDHMRLVPFDVRDVTGLVMFGVAPITPLLTTVMPVDRMLKTALKLLA
jgi:hypothetical protein